MSTLVTSFSTAARAAVLEARSHLGYREGPRSNQNMFGAEYGWNFVAWCVQFAWYCGHITGSGGGIPKTASTGAAMRWAKSVGRWHDTPQPGDWSIMANSKGATIHTDLVESYNPSRQELITLGGNTSGSFGGSVHEGNGVYRNNRWKKWKQGRILGFVRPLYGVSPEAVKIVQRAEGIKADGKYGPATRAAVQRIQTRYGLKADGFPGPKTIAALTGEDVAETIPPAVDDIVTGIFDDVDVTQRRLGELGYGPLEVDGKYGPITAAATKQYQTDFGITADGRPGPATRSHMEDTMAKIDDILTELKRVRPDIATVHNTVIAKGDRLDAIAVENQRRISQAVAQTGPIHRGGREVSLRQEVADAKTTLLELRGVLDGIAKTLDEALPSKDS